VADLFVGSGVRCVVLSACQSGQASSDELNAGLAQRLVMLGMPLVVGMRESILDRAGILFAKTFLKALGEQKRVDEALQGARDAMTAPLGTANTYRDRTQTAFTKFSQGQWCLPMLLSHDPATPVIDWDFTPQASKTLAARYNQIGDIQLPSVFIGRRQALRELKKRFTQKKIKRLLVTGEGGQGKTALIGELSKWFTAQDYTVCAFSARPEHSWDNFIFELEFLLSDQFTESYDKKRPSCNTEEKTARTLLYFLNQQTQGKLVLIFDNLESVQDVISGELTDTRLQTWLNVIEKLGQQAPTVLMTSRVRLPTCQDSEYYPLSTIGYGDFLCYAQRFSNYESIDLSQLREVYKVLGGNLKNLEFFFAAAEKMNYVDEKAFIQLLAETSKESQLFMTLEKNISLLTEEARTLLNRLLIYKAPVPKEGIVSILGEGLDQAEQALKQLTHLSLLDISYTEDFEKNEYLCSSLVREWLIKQKVKIEQSWYQKAAKYQQRLFKIERKKLSYALIVHQALQDAGLQKQANQFALDYIVWELVHSGQYHAVLEDWLPDLLTEEDKEIKGQVLGLAGKTCLHVAKYEIALSYLQQSLAIQQEIGDKSGEGTTLNNISGIYRARGDYETALSYLQQSLVIQQEIGDKSGEGTTLNNISGIYRARGDYETALSYLQQSLAIVQEIGDKSGEGTTLNNMSAIAYAKGDYETALSYLQQSLAIQQEIGDKSGEGTTLNNISQIFQSRGDYETALSYLQQSLIISQEIGDKSGEGTTLNNISQTFQSRGDYETALSYLQQSLAIRQEIGDKSGEGTTLNNISQIFKNRGDYETALSYLQQSLAIQQEIGDLSGSCITLINMGVISVDQGKKGEGMAALVHAYQIAKTIGYAQALDALESLACQVGGTGLDDWEQLAKQL